ncbi:hypothetical protein D3C75_677730 [compost metagenome]
MDNKLNWLAFLPSIFMKGKIERFTRGYNDIVIVQAFHGEIAVFSNASRVKINAAVCLKRYISVIIPFDGLGKAAQFPAIGIDCS